MSICYSKKDAKRIGMIKTTVIRVQKDKALLIRRCIEDRLTERKLGVTL